MEQKLLRQRLDASAATGSLMVALCAYEAAALATGRVPSVSSLCRRYRWVEAGLLAALVVHLHRVARP